MKNSTKKFAEAAKAAYTAYREINTAHKEGAHPDTTAETTTAAFKAIAIAFDALAIITKENNYDRIKT